MTESIWGANIHQAPAEERMTEFTNALTVEVEMVITHADGTTETEVVTLTQVPNETTED